MNMDEERDLVVFEDDAGNDDDDGDEDEPIEVFIMEVRPVGEDQEEFVEVDEKLAETLIKIFESNDLEEVFDEEDEE